jgi:hypothetical protein
MGSRSHPLTDILRWVTQTDTMAASLSDAFEQV